MTITTTRRRFLAGTTVLGATLAAPAVLRAQGTVIRWGEMLAPTHPQVQMIDRIAAAAKEASSGRIDIQSFPSGQLGSGKDMMDMVVSGALAMTTDGAAALGALLPPLSVMEAPYLWRDPAHLAKASGSDVFAKLNDEMVGQRGLRMMGVTYYGKRHVTTGSKEVRSVADMAGLKLRVPPVDTFQAMVAAWGGQATPINFKSASTARSLPGSTGLPRNRAAIETPKTKTPEESSPGASLSCRSRLAVRPSRGRARAPRRCAATPRASAPEAAEADEGGRGRGRTRR